MIKKRTVSAFLAFLLLANITSVAAAPSGNIYFPEGGVSSTDNVLTLGGSANVTVSFKNTAGANVSDVASTIQYITLAAAVVNPTRTQLRLNATWEIYAPDSNVPRAYGTINGTLDTAAIFSPHSNISTVYLYTWAFGAPNSTLEAYTDSSQFNDELLVLRPSEVLNLTVTEECQGIVGDCRIWFFFLATEFDPNPSAPPTDLSSIPEGQRMNIYYSKAPGPDQTSYWWPLHNSYDPYDADIGTGHSFGQLSWSRNPTTNAYAKSNKLVHQKPLEDPVEERYSFHICGIKFGDLNRDGIYDPDLEPGIDGINVTLLGADMITPAEDYYSGDFSYPVNEANPMQTGENLLPGSYCFNLENVSSTGGINNSGTYIFYVRIEEPTQYVNTTPTMIGPITLVASIEGPRESRNNHFGNAPIASNNETRVPVGGVILQVDVPLTVGEVAASNALMLIIVAAGAIALTLVINKKQK
ncbi:MAG: hypothetical protein WHS82_04625 [Candidatus Methanosuratincola sp.]